MLKYNVSLYTAVKLLHFIYEKQDAQVHLLNKAVINIYKRVQLQLHLTIYQITVEAQIIDLFNFNLILRLN